VVALITNVEIRNFKGIKQCGIEDVKRINVFIGKNDSCKSTIIESIYYSLSESLNPNLRNIFGKRSNVFWGAKELWFNYLTGNPITTKIMFDKASVEMKIGLHETSKEDYYLDSYMEMRDFKTNKTHGQTIANYSKDFSTVTKGTFGVGLFDHLSDTVGDELNTYFEEMKFLDSSDKNDIISI